MRHITIAGRKIGKDYPAWIVAEVGINHNGSVARALEMVSMAAAAGVDAVKFGVFKADEFCARSDPLYDTFKRCELPEDAWAEIKARCGSHNVVFFATPQNKSDLDILLKVGVPCVKVGSDDLGNLALIRSYASHGLPMILSTGMAFEEEVVRAVDAVGNHPLILCVCTSEYPCPPEHANLARLDVLAAMFPHVLIGFSDHTIGSQAATVAACLDAVYFEKHMTLDNALAGPDHAFSANPEQLANWAWSIRNVKKLLGNGELAPTRQEMVNATMWKRASGQRIRGGKVERHAA